jgi:preprotein translocase subunit SecB
MLNFEHVWVREAVFVDVEDDFAILPPDQLRAISMKLEVKVTFTEGGNRAFVRLRAAIDPPVERPSFARLSAAVEGAFTMAEGRDAERLTRFARAQAPVLLLPYLRSVVSNLTALSRIGTVVLPPINMIQLIGDLQTQSTPQPTGT